MRKIILLGFLVLLGFFCGPVHALMVSQSLSDLAIGSDAIVYGTITDVKSQWNAAKTHIETTATITIIDAIKSNADSGAGKTITVKTLGGTVGNQTETAEDVPDFRKGTTAVVFLKKTSTGGYGVYGLRQGYYLVINGQIGGDKLSKTGKDVMAFENEIRAMLPESTITRQTTVAIPSTTVTVPSVTVTVPSTTARVPSVTITVPSTTTQKAPVLIAPIAGAVLLAIFLIHNRKKD